MLVIPAIDILGGECVRLKRGDFADKKVYSSDPVAVAVEFERQGAGMLHIVDLDGAKTGRPANTEVIGAIKKAIRIPLEVGGGIRNAAVARKYLAFADRIVLGTKALEDISFIEGLIREFGSDRIIVALETKGGKVATEGWQQTLEGDFLEAGRKLKRAGVTHILFTDVGRDGMLGEPNYDMALQLVTAGFNVIASGGVSDVKALRTLSSIGASRRAPRR